MHEDDPLLPDIRQQLQQILQAQQVLSRQLEQLKRSHETILGGMLGHLGSLRSMQMQQSLGSYALQVGPLPPPADPPRPPVTLSVVAVARDDGPYLREWIEYHKLVGVQRLYFYDSGSVDCTREVLQPYIEDGSLIYHYRDGYHIQDFACADALWRYRFETKWLALLDTDEFMVPVQHDTLLEFLADFEDEHVRLGKGDYCGLAMNWLCFDSNGHDIRPTAHGGLVTANYTRVRRDHDRHHSDYNDDRLVKNIVNPRAILGLRNHNVVARHMIPLVTENHEPVWGLMTEHYSGEKIQCNHYRTKSREEYVAKQQRNARWIARSVVTSVLEKNINFDEPTEQNLAIQRFVPALKQAMGIADE